MARKQAGKKKATNKKFRERFPARDSAAVRALAENVKRLRKSRQWSQDQLAAELNIEQNAVSLLENARANPTLLFIEQVSRLFGVAPFELLKTPAPKV